MKIFKNSVGRPSNETLRKRKVFMISAIAIVALLAGIGIFVGIKYTRGDMNSDSFNLSSSPVVIDVAAIDEESNRLLSIGHDIGVMTLSGWHTYKVALHIQATSTKAPIKQIVIDYNDDGYYEDNTSAIDRQKNIEKQLKTILHTLIFQQTE